MARADSSLDDSPSPLGLRVAILHICYCVFSFSDKLSGDASDSIYSLPSELSSVDSFPGPDFSILQSV